MSATKTHHHDTIEAATRYPYQPETIANLEGRIEHDIARGRTIAAKLFDTHRRRLSGLPTNPPAWVLRRQLERIQDQLDLAISERDRRRI